MLEEQMLPAALRDVDLGSDVIEIGPGPGLASDVLRRHIDNLFAVELGSDLAAALEARLRGTDRLEQVAFRSVSCALHSLGR